MNTIKTITLPVGYLRANCYLYFNEATREGLVIDPGDDPPRLVKRIDKAEFSPTAVLLTHGHFDHVGAAREISKHYGIPIAVHEAEAGLLADFKENGSRLNGLNDISIMADRLFKDGEDLGLGLTAIHTPGHTAGGCCFYSEAEKILFSGDTLFEMSIGRSDFPTGNHGDLINSIKKRLLTLPRDVTVFPGHGNGTTIGKEATSNPYVFVNG